MVYNPDARESEQYTLPLEKRHPELVKRLRDVARQLALEKGEITADDVHDAHPIPELIDGRIMGAVFGRKHWVCTGYVPSRRKDKNHGRRIARWQLREAQAA